MADEASAVADEGAEGVEMMLAPVDACKAPTNFCEEDIRPCHGLGRKPCRLDSNTIVPWSRAAFCAGG